MKKPCEYLKNIGHYHIFNLLHVFMYRDLEHDSESAKILSHYCTDL